jgi:hypothetical protein
MSQGPSVVVYACNPSYSGGRGRIVVQGWPRQKCTTLSEKQTKNPKDLWFGSRVECLPNNHGLSSIPSTTKKKKENNKEF